MPGTRAKDTTPPRTGADEKATLRGFLDYLRNAVADKVTGAPEPQVRTSGVPSDTSLLGLLKHLASVERFYFLGEDAGDWRATMRPSPEGTVDDVLADYRETIQRANQVIDDCPDLTLPAPSPSPPRAGAIDALGPGTPDRGDRPARRPRRHPPRADRRIRWPLTRCRSVPPPVRTWTRRRKLHLNP